MSTARKLAEEAVHIVPGHNEVILGLNGSDHPGDPSCITLDGPMIDAERAKVSREYALRCLVPVLELAERRAEERIVAWLRTEIGARKVNGGATFLADAIARGEHREEKGSK